MSAPLGLCTGMHARTPAAVEALARDILADLPAAACAHRPARCIDVPGRALLCSLCWRTQLVTAIKAEEPATCSTCPQPAVSRCVHTIEHDDDVLIVGVNSCLTCTEHHVTLDFSRMP